MIKYIKINMRLIHNIIAVRALGGCYLLNRGMSRMGMRMEGAIGRVGMRMLMMRGGMGMISMVSRSMVERGMVRDNIGSLLDKDRGMVGRLRVVYRLTLYDLMICLYVRLISCDGHQMRSERLLWLTIIGLQYSATNHGQVGMRCKMVWAMYNMIIDYLIRDESSSSFRFWHYNTIYDFPSPLLCLSTIKPTK
jgi:hypothetical protein